MIQDPSNIHALSNLIRFHVTYGNIDQARSYVEPLISSQADAWDGWTKKVEALSYLADDARVIEIYEQIKAQNPDDQPVTGLFYHLVAVAYAQTGQDKIAKQLWRRALELEPQMAIAQNNIDDLLLPEGKRHGAWPMDLINWISPQAGEDLRQYIESVATSRKSVTVAPALKTYFKRHPEVLTLLPNILERGGPFGQEFMTTMAEGTQLPELLDIIKDFALGQKGNDQLRYQMARIAVQAGLMPKGIIKLWLQGDWHEVILTNYNISDEPSISHSKKVASLLQKAVPLIKQDDDFDSIEEGIQYLKQALEIEPDSPDLLNNLAMAYQQLGDEETSNATLEEVSQRFPDYVFTAAALARRKVSEKDLDAAEALIKPCINREKFHYEEFAAYMDAQLTIALAKKQQAGVQSWLNMWEQVDPEHPRLIYWQERIKRQVFFS